LYVRDSALPGTAQRWHWLSMSIQVQLILKRATSSHSEEKNEKGKTYRAHARLCRWPCISKLGAIADVVKQYLKRISYEVLIHWQWNYIVEIKSHYVLCAVPAKTKKRPVAGRDSESKREGHVYLYVFVVSFGKSRGNRHS
jgi:hypothetical protein